MFNNVFFFTLLSTLPLCFSILNILRISNERRPEDCSQSPNISSNQSNSPLSVNDSEWSPHDLSDDEDIENAQSLVSYSRARFQAASADATLKRPTHTASTPHYWESRTGSAPTPAQVQPTSTVTQFPQSIPSSLDMSQTQTEAGHIRRTQPAEFSTLLPPTFLPIHSESGRTKQSDSRESTGENIEIAVDPQENGSGNNERRTTEADQSIFNSQHKVAPTNPYPYQTSTSKVTPSPTSVQDSEKMSTARKERSECFVEYECRERVAPGPLTKTASDVRRITVRIPVLFSPGPSGPPGPRGEKGARGAPGDSPNGVL